MKAGSRCTPSITTLRALISTSSQDFMLTMVRHSCPENASAASAVAKEESVSAEKMNLCFFFKYYALNVNRIIARPFFSNWRHVRSYCGSAVLVSIDTLSRKDLKNLDQHNEAIISTRQPREPNTSTHSRQVASKWRSMSLIDAARPLIFPKDDGKGVASFRVVMAHGEARPEVKA